MFIDDKTSKAYKAFKRSVFEQVEDAEVEEDEEYPTALFYIDREDNSDILTIEDIAEEYELEEDTMLAEIIEEIFPEELAKREAKFYALVFPGIHDDNEDEPIIAILMGALLHAEIFFAPVYVDDAGLYAVADWEKDSPLAHPQLSIPYRRAVTYQG